MTKSTRRRQPMVSGVTVLLATVLAGWGCWAWWNGDEQTQERFLTSIRELNGVRGAKEGSSTLTVEVRMKRNATVAQVMTVARQAENTGCCRLTTTLGSATMPAEDPRNAIRGYRHYAQLLTRLGQVRFAGSINIPADTGDMLRLKPARRGRGTKRAQREATEHVFEATAGILRALDAGPREATARISSIYARVSADTTAVNIGDVSLPDVRRRARRLLAAIARLDTPPDGISVGASRQAEVSASTTSLKDVSYRWARVTMALDAIPQARVLLRVQEHNDDPSLVLAGPASSRPAKALALVRVARRAGATPTYVRTDRAHVSADVAGPGAASRLARDLTSVTPARARLSAAWGPSTDQSVGNQVTDRIAVVADLAPRLARLARRGYVVGWQDGSLVARPRKQKLRRMTDDPPELREVARSIRAVDWPGEAHLDLYLGRSDEDGGCQGAARVVSLRSKARGRGHDFAASACAHAGDVAAARRAWNAAG